MQISNKYKAIVANSQLITVIWTYHSYCFYCTWSAQQPPRFSFSGCGDSVKEPWKHSAQMNFGKIHKCNILIAKNTCSIMSQKTQNNNTTPETVCGGNVVKSISGVTWLGPRAGLSGCFLVKWLPLAAKHRKCSNLSQDSKWVVSSGEMNTPNYVADIIMHAATDLDPLGPLRETNKVGSMAKLQW